MCFIPSSVASLFATAMNQRHSRVLPVSAAGERGAFGCNLPSACSSPRRCCFPVVIQNRNYPHALPWSCASIVGVPVLLAARKIGRRNDQDERCGGEVPGGSGGAGGQPGDLRGSRGPPGREGETDDFAGLVSMSARGGGSVYPPERGRRDRTYSVYFIPALTPCSRLLSSPPLYHLPLRF